jgi:hypothetical protein
MAYDLCYGGWDEAFRDRVRKEIEFYDPGKELGPAKPANVRLEDLARGSKHGPLSNHWGPQIGGAAIALWAVRNDPGVDNERIDRLLAVNKQCQLRQLAEGQGDHRMAARRFDRRPASPLGRCGRCPVAANQRHPGRKTPDRADLR